MTPATLRTLREALGFTAQGLADHVGVNRRTVVRWEQDSSEWSVPDDVVAELTRLANWVETTVDSAIETVDTQDPPEGTPIDLYRYLTAESARRAGITVPWCVHSASVGRIAGELLALGFVPVVHYVPVEN